MRKKINYMLVLIATLAIVLTTVLITYVYYEVFRKQVTDDLHAYAIMISGYEDVEAVNGIAEALHAEEIRITFIGPDGLVDFDSEADVLQMENHSRRPEILQALESGKGHDMRRSATLSKNTFYYAVRLENGSILRVAKDAGSIYGIFGKAVPSLVGVLVVLLSLCLCVAHFLTLKLIRPIEEMAEMLNDDVEETDYEELIPFMNTIRKQHQDIMKSAKMRQEFTANVSHELKTPLTSISGYAELIENGMASETDIIRFAQGIRKSAQRLLTLINDIIRLYISRSLSISSLKLFIYATLASPSHML